MSKTLTKTREKARRNIKPRVTRSSRLKGVTPLTLGMEETGRDIVKSAAPPLEALTPTQAQYINSIKVNKLTFGIGPAGTGKSFVAASLAATALVDGEIERIIVTRPIVEAGEQLGFLPGTEEEKTAPYFAPIRLILEKRLGKTYVEYLIKSKKIIFTPLAYLRGHTLDNAYVLLDEAQNTTPTQMKLFLTRLGEGCVAIVDGDTKQCDLKGSSGLPDAVRRLSHLKGVGVTRFTKADIVRSGLVQMICEAYDDDEADDGTDAATQGLLSFLQVK